MTTNPLRNIPSVSELLESPPLKKLVSTLSQNVVVSTVRRVLDEVRSELQNSASQMTMPSVPDLAERIARRVVEDESPVLRPVVNATGVLLPRQLGRAPLAEEAVAQLTAVARDYASVELNLATGHLCARSLVVEAVLRELTGAESALVVPSSAAAVFLTLASVAAGREVAIARGQLGEIDDDCRLPDLAAASGAVLREVGATNRTSIDDYARAINERTAALVFAEPSTYAVIGCDETVTLDDLAKLARQHKLPLIYYLGSGALMDLGALGLPGEPHVRDGVRAGADLVLFGGDKLLGGPRCGIVVGRNVLVDVLGRHPLAAALQVDKLTLASLAATLELYQDPEKAKLAIPLLQLLGTSEENLRNRAQRLAPQMAAVSAIKSAEPVRDVTYLAGHAIPAQQLPTWCIALKPAAMAAEQLAAGLRAAAPAVVGRVLGDRLLLDLRSVMPRHDLLLLEAVEALVEAKQPVEEGRL